MRYTTRVFVIVSRFKQKFITYVSHDIQENILPVAPFYPDINGGVIQIVTHSVCKQTFEWYCTSKYNQKLNSIINDHTKFTPLSNDPTEKREATLQRYLRVLKSKGVLSDEIYS